MLPGGNRVPGTSPVAGRRWPIARWPASLGPPWRDAFAFAVLVRESNPSQPDYWSGALSTELTCSTRPSVRTHLRNTRRQPPRTRTGAARRWPGRIRGAGGSRTHSKLLCRQPPCRLAPAPFRPLSLRERARVRAACVTSPLPKGEGTILLLQRPTEESNLVLQICSLPCYLVHLQGQRLDQDSNLDPDLRRVRCDPLHHRDKRQEREDSNPVGWLWRPSALPGAHPCKQ